jgi:hypothetical protein
MQTAFFYLIGLGAFAFVLGGVIAIVALRNAPEGYETDEGFVGLTKGDEVLLKEFAEGRHFPALQGSMGHGSMDLAA